MDIEDFLLGYDASSRGSLIGHVEGMYYRNLKGK